MRLSADKAYEKYADRVFAAAFSVCRDRADADDVTRSLWHKSRVPWEEYMAELPFEEPADGRLFGAVMALPERYRVVIHLVYYGGYGVSEIARLLSAREGAVKSRLSRGRKLLKNMLKEEWDDDE